MKKRLMALSISTVMALSSTSFAYAGSQTFTADYNNKDTGIEDMYFENTVQKIMDEAEVTSAELPTFEGSVEQGYDMSFDVESPMSEDQSIDIDLDYTDDGSSIQGSIVLKGDMATMIRTEMGLDTSKDSVTCDFYLDNDQFAFSVPFFPNGFYIDLNSDPAFEMLKYDNSVEMLNMFSEMSKFTFDQDALNDMMYDYLDMFIEYMHKGEMEQDGDTYTYTMDDNTFKNYLEALSKKVLNDDDLKDVFMTYQNMMVYYTYGMGDMDYSLDDMMQMTSDAILAVASEVPEEFKLVEEYTVNGDYIQDLSYSLYLDDTDEYYEFGYNSEMTNGNILEDISTYFNYINLDESQGSMYINMDNSLKDMGNDEYSQVVYMDMTVEENGKMNTVFEMTATYDGSPEDGNGYIEMYAYDDFAIAGADYEIASEEKYNEMMPVYNEYTELEYTEENMDKMEELMATEGFYDNFGMMYTTSYEEYVEYMESMQEIQSEYEDLSAEMSAGLPDDTALYLSTNYSMKINDGYMYMDYTDADMFISGLVATRINNGNIVIEVKDLGDVQNSMDTSDYINAEELFNY